MLADTLTGLQHESSSNFSQFRSARFQTLFKKTLKAMHFIHVSEQTETIWSNLEIIESSWTKLNLSFLKLLVVQTEYK